MTAGITDQEVMDRYCHGINDYTAAELSLYYKNGTAESRLELIKLLARHHAVPECIVRLALKDPDGRIRHALANGTCLDQETRQRLRQDPEPVVRAAVCEKPEFLGLMAEDQRTQFDCLSHLERLALMRNSDIRYEVVESVFDCPCICSEPSDQGRLDFAIPDVDISHKERVDLITAYLTSPGFLGRCSGRFWGQSSTPLMHRVRLWELEHNWGNSLEARMGSLNGYLRRAAEVRDRENEPPKVETQPLGNWTHWIRKVCSIFF